MEKLAFDLMAGVALQQAIDFGAGGSILRQVGLHPFGVYCTSRRVQQSLSQTTFQVQATVYKPYPYVVKCPV
jgi:hypothetical protein